MPLKPILIAEDNPDDAEIIRKIFAQSSVQNPLVFVRDGDEAVAYLKREELFANPEHSPTPAMLMLDLNMPRMGGLQFLAWLRTQPRPTFPIVILTGYHDLSRMKDAYQLGAYSFLLKPVERNDLAAFVQQFKGIEIGGPAL